jgi:DNA-binding MarR family transcriptional regulator
MTESVSGAAGVSAGVPHAPSLALLLKQSEHRIRLRLQPTLDELGFTLEHWWIMAVLRERPGLGMSPLAEAAAVPSATLTRHVDKLVERGMVVRRVDPADKRRVVAALSPGGELLAERLRAEEQQVEDAIAAGLGVDRFRALSRELSLLPHALD